MKTLPRRTPLALSVACFVIGMASWIFAGNCERVAMSCNAYYFPIGNTCCREDHGEIDRAATCTAQGAGGSKYVDPGIGRCGYKVRFVNGFCGTENIGECGGDNGEPSCTPTPCDEA